MTPRFASLGLSLLLLVPSGSSAQDPADSVVPPTDLRDVLATEFELIIPSARNRGNGGVLVAVQLMDRFIGLIE
jgi:hypothetical protein